GKLKLLDFGVAKAAFNVEADGEGLSIVGTPEYMAPEQARGTADERSDIYALGVVLFELLSGRLPHEAESPVLLLDAKFRKEPESLRNIAPERGIPKMLDAAVSRALSTEPEHRYKSAAELREALEAALREPEAPSARRKLVTRGLASAVALAVIGVIGVGAARPAVRERAVVALAPMIEKMHALQARAAERMHGAHPAAPAPTQVAALKLDAPASVTVVATPEPAPAPVAPEAALAANTAANDDGEVEDDSQSSDSATPEKAEPASAVSSAELPSAGADAIAEAHKYAAAGNKLKALNLLRHAAKKFPKDGKVLAELASAAEQDRAWGEAVRVARRLVEVEPSAESKLELARLERKTGHRSRALELVRSVLKDSPDSPEATAMLNQLGGTERVALQK
ncbi:MAG: protein kinase, partial [Myxococcales bacterium]